MRTDLTHTLKSYLPNLLAQLKERQEQALQMEAVPFKVLESYAYTDEYCKFNGLWYLQNSDIYTYNPNRTDGWVLLQNII